MHAKVELTALFGEKDLKVSDLLNLKPGDIIPIEMPECVTLMTEDMPVMRGEYGEYEGSLAVKIREVVELPDPDDELLKRLNPADEEKERLTRNLVSGEEREQEKSNE